MANKLFEWLLRKPPKEPKGNTRKVVVDAGKPIGREEKDFLKSLGLRQGMWVATDQGVGLVLGADPEFVAVQLVDDKGENRLSVNVLHHVVKQAKYREIPKSRRERIAPDVAKAYGYE